ncbi:uncharacterized protein [Dendrobates tinctorius]|uniref:uncharacterized protein isoform X2 n=1 Tax=Dendrobates tinctorius TaxID=92724 RepID=UPI003CCA2939
MTSLHRAPAVCLADGTAPDTEAGISVGARRRGPGKQDESFFNKIGIYTSKLTSLNCWKGMKEETRQLDKDIHNFTNSCLNGNHELSECQTNEGQAYIPYEFAKMYITKIAVDMQKMKLKYMDFLKKMDINGKKQQGLEMEKEEWKQEKMSLVLEIKELKERVEYKKCRAPEEENMELEPVKCPLCKGDYWRHFSAARMDKAKEMEAVSYIN